MLPTISVKELNKAVKKYFTEDDLNVIVVAPEEEKIPPKDTIKKIIKASKKMKVSAPKEENLKGDLLDKAPVAGKVLSETTDDKTNTVIWRLSNGTTVVLKKTDNKTDEIVINALAKGGILDVPKKDIVSAQLAASMFNVSGSGKYSKDELSKNLLINK
jgi:zinc protease